MKPMYLPTVEHNEKAGGGFGSRALGKRVAGSVVPQIFHLLSYKPAMTLHLERLTHEVLRGPLPLSPGFRELIGAFTGRRNECDFCMGAHAAVATELMGDRALVDSVLADYQSSALSEAEKALLAFVEKLNADGAAICEQDVDLLHAAGWNDEAIYDASLSALCSIFTTAGFTARASATCRQRSMTLPANACRCWAIGRPAGWRARMPISSPAMWVRMGSVRLGRN